MEEVLQEALAVLRDRLVIDVDTPVRAQLGGPYLRTLFLADGSLSDA